MNECMLCFPSPSPVQDIFAFQYKDGFVTSRKTLMQTFWPSPLFIYTLLLLSSTRVTLFVHKSNTVDSPMKKKQTYKTNQCRLDGGNLVLLHLVQRVVLFCCLALMSMSNWVSAVICPLWVQTVHSQTSLLWTVHRPSWSPVCNSAGQCDRCFHSAWRR